MKKLLKKLLFVSLTCLTMASGVWLTKTNTQAKLSDEDIAKYTQQIQSDISGTNNNGYCTISYNQNVLTIRVNQDFSVPVTGMIDDVKIDGSIYSNALYNVLKGYYGVEEIIFQGKKITAEYSASDDWLHRIMEDYKSSIISVNFGNSVVFNDNFDGSYMFNGCSSLKSVELPPSSSCNIANASYMFKGCTSLSYVNWESIFDGSLKNAEGLLSNSGITSLDISGFTANGISSTSKTSKQDFLYNSNVTEVRIPDGVNYYLHVGGNSDKVWVTDDNKCYQDGKITDTNAGGVYRLNSRISTANYVYVYGNSSVETVAEDYDVSTTLKVSKQREPKDGYKYVGCFYDREGRAQVQGDISAYKLYKPTLYYLYSPVSYTITYSGVPQGSMRYYKYTVEDDFALEAGVKNGMDFQGWYTSKNLYADTYIAKINKGTTGDLKLYPKWGYHKYKLTYKLNGGKNHKLNKKSYTVEAQTIKLYKPKKKGCKFLGWYYDPTFENQCFTLSTSKRSDITLYAKWEDPDKSIKPGKVKGIKLKSKGRKITVKFKKDKKYKTSIHISGRKDMYFPDTFNVKQKSTKITSAKLKRGKIYYVRLRHYKKSRTSGKTIYGKWSKMYKIRVKR